MIKYIVWLPGYAILSLIYFFPTEWGHSRNVSRTGRFWEYRNFFAPAISIAIYLLAFNINAIIPK